MDLSYMFHVVLCQIFALQLFQLLKNNNIQISEDKNVTFTDSSWNDYIDTGRSTGGNISLTQGGAAGYSSHLPVPSSNVEWRSRIYISSCCIYESKSSENVDVWFKIPRLWFEWIGTKNQLADILTKSSNAITFSPLWLVILHEC